MFITVFFFFFNLAKRKVHRFFEIMFIFYLAILVGLVVLEYQFMLVVLLTNKHHLDSIGDSTLFIAHKNAQIILVKILSSSQANDKLIRPPIKATHKETSLRGPNIRK